MEVIRRHTAVKDFFVQQSPSVIW